MNADEKLIDAREAARSLGISRSRLYDATRKSLVPAVRIGRTYRYSPSVLRKFIESGGTAWPGGWRKGGSDADPTEHTTGRSRRDLATDSRAGLTRQAQLKSRSR
jgi:excisionase family DNA binding protein